MKKRNTWILIFPWAAAVFLGVLVLDRAGYALLFPIFDQRSTLSGMQSRSSGIVVGSSQTRWGIDAGILMQHSGVDFQIFAPPGSNIALRRAMIQDYLERFSSNPPQVIVLEAHPYLFHRRRYPDDAYRTLLGYRPKGLLSDYLKDRFGHEPVFLASNVFHTLSFNEEFYATGAGLVDLALLPAKMLRPEGAPPREPDQKEMQDRIAGWARFHNSQKLRPMFDFGMQAEFAALMQFLEPKPVRVVLVEIPLYRLEPGFNDQFDAVRKRMLALKPARFEYVRLDPERFETDPSLFHDASHFGEKGRRLYSEALGRYLAAAR